MNSFLNLRRTLLTVPVGKSVATRRMSKRESVLGINPAERRSHGCNEKRNESD